MSKLDDQILAVAAQHFLQHGEEVTFRGERIEALVDMGAGSELLMRGQTDFLPTATSVVTVLQSSVRALPQKGEAFTDDLGRTHRVLDVVLERVQFRCVCQVSDAPPIQ